MTLSIYQMTVTDDEGNTIPGASVEVRKEIIGTPLASLCSDRAGMVPISNPTYADGSGFVTFYTDGGFYKVTASDGISQRVWRYVYLMPIFAPGTVPIADANGVLGGDTITVPYTALPVFTATTKGAVPASGTDASKTLFADGVWRIPDGSRIKDLANYSINYDGSDETTTLLAAITSIGSTVMSLFVSGPVKVSATIIFHPNTQIIFLNGGYFTGVAGTEEVAVQSQIVAGRQQIFAHCAPYSSVPQETSPHWFGAKGDDTADDYAAFVMELAFLKDVGGTIELGPYKYKHSSQIQITAVAGHIAINGSGNNISYLKCTGGVGVSGLGVYGSSGSIIPNIMLRDFSFQSTAPGTGNVGIDLSWTAFPILERMQIHDFLYGLVLTHSSNSQISKVGATYSGSANGARGFYINGALPTPNASSIFRDCYTQLSASYTSHVGYYIAGDYVTDLQFYNCETALTNYGYYVDFSGVTGGGNEDFRIDNPINDRFSVQGILINALPGGAFPGNGNLVITGGWSNPNTTGAETDAIYLLNCVGMINIDGHEFCADTNFAFARGVFANGSTNWSVTNCQFKDQAYGVEAINSRGRVQSCKFKNASGRTASAYVGLQGDLGTVIKDNDFDGYATFAVNVDNTSINTYVGPNSGVTTHIGTMYSNLSVGGLTVAFGEMVPPPSTANLGGVNSKAAVTSQWLKSLATTGIFTATQPAFTDISGSVTASQMPALTGDITTSAGAVATTLATSGVTAATYGDASHVTQVTFDAKGRATTASSVAIAIASGAVSGLSTIATSGSASDLASGTVAATRMPALTGDITTSAGAVATTLATSGVTAATYGDASHVTQVTFDAKGRATTASSVAIAIAESAVTNLTTDLAAKAALAGASFTGNIDVSSTNPIISVKSTSAGKTVSHYFWDNGTVVWLSGVNYNNAGDAHFFIARNSGSGNILLDPSGGGAKVAIGAITPSVLLDVNGAIRTRATVVNNLAAAATAGAGARHFVTDALAPSYGVAVTGGGAVGVPVVCDGTTWKVG